MVGRVCCIEEIERKRIHVARFVGGFAPLNLGLILDWPLKELEVGKGQILDQFLLFALLRLSLLLLIDRAICLIVMEQFILPGSEHGRCTFR